MISPKIPGLFLKSVLKKESDGQFHFTGKNWENEEFVLQKSLGLNCNDTEPRQPFSKPGMAYGNGFVTDFEHVAR